MKPFFRFVALGAVLFALLRHLPASRDPATRHHRAERAPAQARGEDPSDLVDLSDETILIDAALKRRLGEDDVIVQRRVVENARTLGLESEVPQALDLSDGDPIITRRLIQQMLLQLASEARRVEPTETELRAYLADHADRFALPARVRVEHVFFSNGRRGNRAEHDATSGRVDSVHLTDRGDPFLWPSPLPLQSASELEKIFGDAAPSIARAPLNQWSGPYRSALGYHVVRVVERVEPSEPAFAAVRAAVRLALLNDRAEQHIEQTLAGLR
jgi:hypothetical protein